MNQKFSEEKTFELKEEQQFVLHPQLEDDSSRLTAPMSMDNQISSNKDAAMISLCQRNQTLFLEMMHQQNLLLRGGVNKHADVSTKNKSSKKYKSANELGLYL